MLASRQGSAQSVRFLLKDSLKYVPVAGGYLNLVSLCQLCQFCTMMPWQISYLNHACPCLASSYL